MIIQSVDHATWATFLISFLSAGGVTIALKLSDKIFPDAKERKDGETAFREELRADSNMLRGKLKEAFQDYDALHDKHIALQNQYATLQADKERLERDLVALTLKCNQLSQAVDRLRAQLAE